MFVIKLSVYLARVRGCTNFALNNWKTVSNTRIYCTNSHQLLLYFSPNLGRTNWISWGAVSHQVKILNNGILFQKLWLILRKRRSSGLILLKVITMFSMLLTTMMRWLGRNMKGFQLIRLTCTRFKIDSRGNILSKRKLSGLNLEAIKNVRAK